MSATSLSPTTSHDIPPFTSHDPPPTASHGSPRPFQRKSRLEDGETDLAQIVAKKVKEYLLDFNASIEI